jgi:serine/threonine protein kinase
MSTDPSTPENDANLSGLGRALMGTNEGSKPSGPWVPPSAEELHQILPQYEIVKMLGRGGMGAVYMGRQTALDRPVAIKILSAQLEESDMGFTERFKNEARAMGKLNHPSIVSVYEFGQHESGLLYIVMEYVDGTDVAKMIAKSGRLHTEHAMAITAHVCDALAYAHERGIIHRDIKPANIMVGYDGMVKVADFGLAKVSTSGGQTLGLTQSGMAMGTLHFMAPEALMLGSAVDHRADIYAVGVMLYQMLTGKLPQGMFKMPSLQVPGLDPRYDGIIAKAMMEDREARYQSARAMRSDLDGILTQPVVRADPEAANAQQPVLPTQARPQRPGGKPVMRQSAAPSVPQPAPHSSQSWLWTSALGLLVLGGAAWWMIQPRSQTGQPAAAEGEDSTKPVHEAQTIAASATTTTPAEATKERPFVNSLGMKFVPVPGTNVLFCIHETRYRDYAAFASEVPNVDGSWKEQTADGFVITEENENHPVVKVSWEDAQKFCDWLGKKAGQTYRLPTDQEWSVAVGIGEYEKWEADTMPITVLKPQNEFPWGAAWPAIDKAGNYGDLSRKTKAPRKGATYLENYDDGFPTTSPVMSFVPNSLGLYDMGGNAREWVEDWYSNEKKGRAVRGGGWSDFAESYLLSSWRRETPSSERIDISGFRVVLVVDRPIATAPASTEAAVRMILGKGGSATILIGKEQRVVTRVEQLPKDSYEVVELRLTLPAGKKPTLSSADLQTLAGLQALERLKLSDVSFPEGDLSVLRTLPRLAFLELRGSKGLTVESFSPLAGMRSLTHLSTINMPEVDETLLPVILSLSQLESLGLHECKGVSTGFVESLAVLPKLNSLTVSGFQFGNANDLGKFRALQTLGLYDFRGSALDAALKGLAAGNVIKHLYFHGCDLTEVQMQEIARWPTLRSLFLENVKLPGSRLNSLSGSQVQVLDACIYDRQLDDEALLSAGRMAALKTLSLGPKSPATEAGIAAFRKARPDVRIARRQDSGQASEDAVMAVAAPAVIPPAARPAVPPPPSAPTPLPKTDPPTWIDTQGRSLQAKFIRIEGASVMVDIAGKATPIALASLSPASQQIARELAATQNLPAASDSSWLEGRWVQVNPEEQTPGDCFLDYLPGGVAMFMGKGHDGIGQWELQGDTLTVRWPRGGTNTLKSVSSAAGRTLRGQVNFTSGRHVAVQEIKQADLLKSSLPAEADLENKVFDFGWFVEGNSSKADLRLSAALHFAPGGRFEGKTNANETRWELKNGELHFFHSNGSRTTTFQQFYRLGNAWTMVGPFHGKPGITHIIRERVSVPMSAGPSSPPGTSSTTPSSASAVSSVDPSLLGLWYQRNDGKSLPFFPFAIFADGSAGFGRVGKGLVSDGRWQKVGNELHVSWPNGCVYEIDLKSGSTKKLSGKGFGDPDFTLEITHTGLKPAADMPAADQLTGLSFDFYYKEKQRAGSNGKLSLLKDGTVVQQSPLRISRWKLANGYLMLLDAHDECLTLLNHFERKNDKWSIRGLHVPVAEVEHSLEER